MRPALVMLGYLAHELWAHRWGIALAVSVGLSVWLEMTT